MKLEGKFKKEFDLYLINTAENFDFDNYDTFYHYPFSMQYGVLVDFCDSIEFLIDNEWFTEFCITIENRDYLTDDENYREIHGSKKTRHESRKQAILKAQEIYNN